MRGAPRAEQPGAADPTRAARCPRRGGLGPIPRRSHQSGTAGPYGRRYGGARLAPSARLPNSSSDQGITPASPNSTFSRTGSKGPVHTSELIAAIEDPASDLPQAARGILAVLVEQLRSLDERVAVLDREIARHATENPVARWLMTIPGIGAVTAAARMALAPPADTFRRGRDFAAWLGLAPVQRSSGGKERLGRTSKMGERSLRRLLIIGASAVARWAARKGVPAGAWLARMMSRKPPLLVRVALANKMARVVWALLAKGGVYRAPVVAAA